MSIVLDYTRRIDPVALHAADVSGVCRYLKPDSVPTYRITLAEYRELVAADIDVTLNWEYDAHDWLGGASAGTAHGQEAVRQAKALGYPAGKVIIGSADFDMTATQWNNAGRAYAKAFAAAVRAGGFRPGVYGPWDVLQWVRDERIMDAFWQAGLSTAFSQRRNAATWPGAQLVQRGYKTVGGVQTDWNEIRVPGWGAASGGNMFCQYGDSGDNVLALQAMLIGLGFNVGAPDGSYGDKVAAGLKAALGDPTNDGKHYGPWEYGAMMARVVHTKAAAPATATLAPGTVLAVQPGATLTIQQG